MGKLNPLQYTNRRYLMFELGECRLLLLELGGESSICGHLGLF